MSNCCANKSKENSSPRKFTCPINAQQYVAVPVKTILQHIKSPWLQTLDEDKYYFCDDPECEVVYFGLTGSVITKDELRTVVGVKEKSDETLVCYCFGVSKEQAKQDTKLKKYITLQTKEKMCACDSRNPSGRCCLKDFPPN